MRRKNLKGICKICGTKIDSSYDVCLVHNGEVYQYRTKRKKAATVAQPQFYQKTKTERQNWWKELPEQQKDKYLSRVQERKALKRRNNSIQLMKKLNLHYDCNLCIHGVSHSCTDDLDDGCEYFTEIKQNPLDKLKINVQNVMKIY